MGEYIIKLEGKYLLWSTIVDAPTSYGGTLRQIENHFREQHGERGMRDLPDRLVRVETKGTSAINDGDVEDTIWLNRAGPNEAPLNKEEIVEFFVRRGKSPTADALAAFRKQRGAIKCNPCVAGKPTDDYGQKCACFGTYLRYPESP